MSTATETAPPPTVLEPPALDRTGRVTFDEFCVVIRPEQKADLLDGVIHMASPENLSANELFVWLMSLMNWYVGSAKLGKVFGSRVAFRLNETNGPEPDVAFVKTDRLHLKRKTYFDGPPDLAVEIVSPESARRDYLKKRELYRVAGVPEYWIIDEDARCVSVFRLKPDGDYEEQRIDAGRLECASIPGFWLEVGWLWTETRPEPADALAAILAERSTSK